MSAMSTVCSIIKYSFRLTIRSMSTGTPSYPFSKSAIIPYPRAQILSGSLREGKGLMEFLHKTLPTPEKRELISTYFGRGSRRLLPGSILTVTLEHAPNVFTGVLISVRRRGIDTSFVLRNIVQRTGVEMQFFVNSPHLKDIKVERSAKGVMRSRRAKLFYLRDSPEKMTAISTNIKAS